MFVSFLIRIDLLSVIDSQFIIRRHWQFANDILKVNKR